MAALLLLGAGLFVNIPSISAQQTVEEEFPLQETQAPALDPIRITEQSISLDEMPAGAIGASGSSVWLIIRMLIVLALVAAAIYAVVFFLKKVIKPPAVSDPFLKLLATRHLGANRYVHIVSAGSRAWLLGASDGGVTMISEIEDKEVIDSMLLEDSRKGAQSPGRLPDFLSMLQRFGVRANPASPGTDDIRKRRERLRDM